MTVRPFTPAVLKEILTEYHPGHTAEDLLALYSFTGGVAKYVQLLVDAGATTKSAMLDHIIKADSIFLGEGKAILIEEFGKDYGVYFSILSAIARGKTSRSEIENVVGREIGGYLTKLENEYEVIAEKAAPLREEFHQECPLYDRGQLLHVLVPLHLQVQLYAGDRELREREDDHQPGLRDVQWPDARTLFQACADRTPSLHTHRRMVGTARARMKSTLWPRTNWTKKPRFSR